MDAPQTPSDLQSFIDLQIQEGLHLDYKASASLTKAKRGEIAKDASAFANSDGGLIVYGIEEEGHLPVRVDAGVESAKYSREWLEQVIQSNISPTLDGLRIVSIDLDGSNCAYAVEIAKSYRGPHQERVSNRYYRRHNFRSVPMEDYEINDVRSRSSVVPKLLHVGVEILHGMIIYIAVSNPGDEVAADVGLDFSPELPWRGRDTPPQPLKEGIRALAPGQKLTFLYETTEQVFATGSALPKRIEVTGSYAHPMTGGRVREEFVLDLSDYIESAIIESELYEHGRKVEKALGEITKGLRQMNDSLAKLGTVAGPTGLNLSVTTLRNLVQVSAGSSEVERSIQRPAVIGLFEEVLGLTNGCRRPFTGTSSLAPRVRSSETLKALRPKSCKRSRSTSR